MLYALLLCWKIHPFQQQQKNKNNNYSLERYTDSLEILTSVENICLLFLLNKQTVQVFTCISELAHMNTESKFLIWGIISGIMTLQGVKCKQGQQFHFSEVCWVAQAMEETL